MKLPIFLAFISGLFGGEFFGYYNPYRFRNYFEREVGTAQNFAVHFKVYFALGLDRYFCGSVQRHSGYVVYVVVI